MTTSANAKSSLHVGEARAAEPLIVESVSVHFGGLRVLTDVNLEVRPGAIVGLIGPNGAGKTTLLNVITGFQRPTSGQVSLGSHRLVGMPPHALRQLGISRTFQGVRLFKDMTVSQNLSVAAMALGFSIPRSELVSDQILEWLDIKHLSDTVSGDLPYTDQRRVAIGRAIVGSPTFILFDEPAAGMSEIEGVELAKLVRRLATELNAGIIIIEHNITLVLGLCDWIYVLDSGKMLAQGNPKAIKSNVAVREAYIGSALNDMDLSATPRSTGSSDERGSS